MKLAFAVVAAALLGGCGGDAGSDAPLTVFAASSLSDVIEPLAPGARFNFAGSDELATQIREGAEADVFAAASTRHPEELHAEGLVERPRVFATNRLVLIASDRSIRAVEDLDRSGIKLVVAAESVPVGGYTRDALVKLGRGELLERAVSEEDDVKGVLSKVELGEADAGFVYATDVVGRDRVHVIGLPAAAQPQIEYSVAVVAQSDRRDAARRFVEQILGPDGRKTLAAAGFGLP